MIIDGVSGRTAFLASSILNLKTQLDDLSQQLVTGRKTTTYAGLGIDGSVATGLRAQIERISSFADTQNLLTTRINVANLSLQGIGTAANDVNSATHLASVTIDSDGKTSGQKIAQASFSQTIGLLNIDVAGHFLFSGRATDTTPTVPDNVIMDGIGTQAGLKQLIDERKQADLGAAPNFGRLAVTSPTATSVKLAEDVAPSSFGLKLNAVTSTLSGATVTGPAGTPPAISVDLAANPNNGESIKFVFNLPDGSTEEFTLTATTQVPPPPGTFAIGGTTTATATNLNVALRGATDKLANTALVAASAMQASDEFFVSSPPQRVDGPPFDTATALVNGTPGDTVFWYTGEEPTSPSDTARGTAVVQIDQSVNVQYGLRANESGIVTQLKNIAVYAAFTTNPTDPNAPVQMLALNTRVSKDMTAPTIQKISDIQTELANVGTAVKTVQERQTQSKALSDTMLDSIQGISKEEVATKILALQTSLQASYQTTSKLYQMSLLNFMP